MAIYRNASPVMEKQCTEIKQELTSSEDCKENTEISKGTMFVKQEIEVSDNACIKGEEVNETDLFSEDIDIKQELNELNFDMGSESSYHDIGSDENWSGKVDITDTIKIEEQDVKMYLPDESSSVECLEVCKAANSHLVTESPSMPMRHDQNVVTPKFNISIESASKPDLIKHTFARYSTLRHNENVVTYKCTSCDLESRYSSTLRQHNRLKHNGNVKIHRCTKCSFESVYKSNLTVHNRMKHDKNAVLHKCTSCDYQTKWKNALTAHNRVQHCENVTIYKCIKCNYETKHKSGLTKHYKTQHKENITT